MKRRVTKHHEQVDEMKAKLEEQREKEVDMMKPPYWHADFCPVKVRTDTDKGWFKKYMHN